ncbi:MAG: glutamate--tRNA ligase [Verrucomicrobiota bacterium]
MSDTLVRTRFAPSPTGLLHIGGARTALFNWLHARHTGGQFVLRVEDTDAARNTPEARARIFEGLEWLGLDWDEGPLPDGGQRGDRGPYNQSERRAIHDAAVEKLLSSGHAYAGEDGAVRFKLPNEERTVRDLICGEVTFDLTPLADLTIRRADGSPTFHLVNVVDDLEMGITEVIRGEDHLSNTPKHLCLIEALGATPPRYAHIPLILNTNGSKMSKRDQGASVGEYADRGYLPQAVVNYLCLLGWSPKDNREILPIAEVIQMFRLEDINRGNARFDLDKLFWMNGEYFRQLSVEEVEPMAADILTRAGVLPADGKYDHLYFRAALEIVLPKLKLAGELPEWMDFFFADEFGYDEKAARKHFTAQGFENLRAVKAELAGLADFSPEAIEAVFKALAVSTEQKIAAFVHPVRLALSGKPVGPSLYHLIEVLGRERCLARLERALEQAPA